jgi:hypothetical protein
VGFEDSVRSSASDQGNDRPTRWFWGRWSPGLGDRVLRNFGWANQIQRKKKKWSWLRLRDVRVSMA